MAAAPWYLEQKPGLKHQKAWNAVDKKEGAGASGSVSYTHLTLPTILLV